MTLLSLLSLDGGFCLFIPSGTQLKTRGPSRLTTSPMCLTPLMGSSTWTRGPASTETPKSLIMEWKLSTCRPLTWGPSFTQRPILSRTLWARPQVRSSRRDRGISLHFQHEEDIFFFFVCLQGKETETFVSQFPLEQPPPPPPASVVSLIKMQIKH